MTRRIILTFVGSYLPGYKAGGPVRSIANMVERLGDEFDFRIVTADRDMSDTEAYPNVAADAWNRVGNANVYYASPGGRSMWRIAQLMRETPHDIAYVNSFFDPVFTLRPLLARALGLAPRRPMVIAPRGEFSEGAVALKGWKKRPYIALSRVLGLYDGLTWHASSDLEADDIRREMGSTNRGASVARTIGIAPDLVLPVEDEDLHAPVRAASGPLSIAFLSRIARKKNLDFAIRVLSGVTVPVELSVYGVIEDESYWQQCQDLVRSLGSNIVVRYGGAVPHDLVGETLAAHDLFFFPTRGENYGHVIHEALAAGLPVLLSDQTPWKGLEAAGVGWDLPLCEPLAFAAAIERHARLSAEDRKVFRSRARAYAVAVSADEDAIAANVSLFRGARKGARVV